MAESWRKVGLDDDNETRGKVDGIVEDVGLLKRIRIIYNLINNIVWEIKKFVAWISVTLSTSN